MFSKKPRSVTEIVASFTTITDELQARIEADQKNCCGYSETAGRTRFKVG